MTMDSLIKKAIAKTGEPIKLKRRNAQPEAIEQAKVIAWARANERNYPYLWMLHSSLNGLKRTKNAQVKAKSQGMLSGVPDLFMPVAIGNSKGLYIEMKSAKGRISSEQSKFLKAASDFGYSCFICYSAVEAIDKIKNYYNLSLRWIRIDEMTTDEELKQLREELEVTDRILAEREKVLNAIPECPVHGSGCVPHAIEWIELAKSMLGV